MPSCFRHSLPPISPSRTRSRFVSATAVAAISLTAVGSAASVLAATLDLTRPFHDDPDGGAPAPVSVIVELGGAPLTPDAFHLAGVLPVRRGTLAAVAIEAGEDPEGDAVAGIAFTADGARVLIAERDSRNVVVWNADGTFERAIAVSGTPGGVAVTPDGGWAVVPNLFEDTASILDLTTGVESTIVPVGNQPGCVAVNPSGTLAAVGNGVDGTISVLALPGGAVLRTIPGVSFAAQFSANFESGAIGFRQYGFEFVDDETLVHADYGTDRVLFVEVTTGTIDAVTVADQPLRFGISGDGSTMAVAHYGTTRRVTVLDTASQTVIKTIATSVDLGGPICVDPAGTKAVAAIQNACVVVDLVTNAISPSIDTASVNDLLTTADGLYALGIGFRGSLVSFGTQTLVKNLNNFVSCSLGAVSPTEARAAMVADTFGEDLLFLDTNGAAGFLDVATLSGPADEGDKARIVAVSPDGTRAAVSQILSDNVGFYDLVSGTHLATVKTGDRPSDVAWTPDGSQVCVANLDSSFLTVVDAVTFTATNVPLSTRASQVEISPDGRYAYVGVVASGDGVWRVDLDTLTLAGGKILTGDMGGVGYLYNQTSGMTLSHDGSVLAVCGSFTDNVSFIDTASWTLLGNTPVGDLPVRALFDADDSRLFVSSREDDRIRVLDVATRSVTSTIVTGDWPFEMALSPDETTLYVLEFTAPSLATIDLELGARVASVALPNSPAGLAFGSSGSELFVPTGNATSTFGPGVTFSIAAEGELNVIDVAANAIVEQVDTGVPPAMLALHGGTQQVVVASPFLDGIYVVRLSDPAGLDGQDAPGEPTAPNGPFVGTAGHGDGVLLGAAPLPLRESVDLTFTLGEAASVDVSIHDAAGRLVRTLASGPRGAGPQSLSWDRTDASGARVAPGVYFARVAVGGDVLVRKLVVR